MARFVQEGRTLNIPAGTARTGGDVVTVGGITGIISRNYEASELAAAAVEGVFEFDKASGLVVADGALVYWDTVALTALVASNGNTVLLGRATGAFGSGVDCVEVRLDPNAS